MNSAYGHSPGAIIECLSMAIQVVKDSSLKTGFNIRGGIDRDSNAYPDMGIYVVDVDPDSPAAQAGLKKDDKILQMNGYDFTMITHDKALKYINKYTVLQMLIARTNMQATLA